MNDPGQPERDIKAAVARLGEPFTTQAVLEQMHKLHSAYAGSVQTKTAASLVVVRVLKEQGYTETSGGWTRISKLKGGTIVR